jgi:hypothetical protein
VPPWTTLEDYAHSFWTVLSSPSLKLGVDFIKNCSLAWAEHRAFWLEKWPKWFIDLYKKICSAPNFRARNRRANTWQTAKFSYEKLNPSLQSQPPTESSQGSTYNFQCQCFWTPVQNRSIFECFKFEIHTYSKHPNTEPSGIRMVIPRTQFVSCFRMASQTVLLIKQIFYSCQNGLGYFTIRKPDKKVRFSNG